jgi:hypothetical protein
VERHKARTMLPLERLAEDLEQQRQYVVTRAPVYGRLLELLMSVVPLDRLEDTWRHRTFEAWYDRPLLLLASLRDDALEEGSSHPLDRAIGSGADVDTATPDAMRAAFAPDRSVWRKLRERFVQTNETSRAVTWLWPAHVIGTAHPSASVQIFDIGASAGLNLVADTLPRIWTCNGALLSIDPLPRVTRRCGFDLHPVDVIDEKDARWLRACIWPGQTARQMRLEQAIVAWRQMTPRPELVAARANDVPTRLPRDTMDRLLAYQTVMRDYLTAEEHVRYESGMRAWLDSLPDGQAFWVELEVTPDARASRPTADIVVHARGGEDFVLATCDAHPTALTVFNEAVDAFRRVVT